jgi:8-oxo-dGTP pyrophosphatase MutT (NUDIX family)
MVISFPEAGEPGSSRALTAVTGCYCPGMFPISVKGVVVRDGRVLLLRNERDEWELPGGRLEPDETPEQCVAREVAEEARWHVTIGPILDSWMYHIRAARKHVFIVTYGCFPNGADAPVLSHEHKEVGLFEEHEVSGLTMPDGYRRSIATWYARLRAGSGTL